MNTLRLRPSLGFLNLPDLPQFIKQGSLSLPRNLDLLVKVKYALPPLCNGLEVLFSAYDEMELFCEVSFENSNLDCSGSSPAFCSTANLKIYNILLTLKLIENFVTDCDSF